MLKLTLASTTAKKPMAITTMMATITEVIQVSRRLVQVIFLASMRTSRKNWTRFNFFFGCASAAADGLAMTAAVLAARLRIADGLVPGFLAMSALQTLVSGGGRRAPSSHLYRVAGVEGFEPPALGFGDRCSTS